MPLIFSDKKIDKPERNVYIFDFEYEFHSPYAWMIEIQRISRDPISFLPPQIIKGRLLGIILSSEETQIL
jgi:hypothetical protein